MLTKPTDRMFNTQYYQDVMRVTEKNRLAQTALEAQARPRAARFSLRRVFALFTTRRQAKALCQAAPARCCPQAA